MKTTAFWLALLAAGAAQAGEIAGVAAPQAIPGVYREVSWASPLVGSASVAFGAGSSELSEEARTELDRQASALKPYPTIFVSVGGHADTLETTSDDEANRLGYARAQAVVAYLVEQGVPRYQLVPYTSGSSGIISVQQPGRRGSAMVNLCLLAVAE